MRIWIKDTAYTIVNEGRRLIECDRVSVAMLKGTKAKVVAISGKIRLRIVPISFSR